MKRIQEIDLVRGVAIFLVVLGHTFPPLIKDQYIIAYVLYHFIYNFHMPLFFAVSGFLYYSKKSDLKLNHFIGKKFKQLMIPYISYSVVTYSVIHSVIYVSPRLKDILNKSGYFQVDNIMEFVYSLLTYNDHLDKHLWFIYALFLIFILAELVNKYMRAFNSHFLLAMFLLLSVSSALNVIPTFSIIKLTLYHFIFFYIGKIFAENYNKFSFLLEYKNFVMFSFLIANSFIIFIEYLRFNEIINNQLGELLRILLIYPASILGILSIFIIVYYVKNNQMKRTLMHLSKYSYDIYLIHQPFIVSGSIAILYKFTNIPVLFIILLSLTLGIFIPLFISKWVFRRNDILGKLFLGNFSSKQNINIKRKHVKSI